MYHRVGWLSGEVVDHYLHTFCMRQDDPVELSGMVSVAGAGHPLLLIRLRSDPRI